MTLRVPKMLQARPIEEDEKRPIVVIFHPGKGALLKEVRKQLDEIDPEKSRLQVFVGSRSKLATLISPLGVFTGRERIEDGLLALKHVMKYIV